MKKYLLLFYLTLLSLFSTFPKTKQLSKEYINSIVDTTSEKVYEGYRSSTLLEVEERIGKKKNTWQLLTKIEHNLGYSISPTVYDYIKIGRHDSINYIWTIFMKEGDYIITYATYSNEINYETYNKMLKKSIKEEMKKFYN